MILKYRNSEFPAANLAGYSYADGWLHLVPCNGAALDIAVEPEHGEAILAKLREIHGEVIQITERSRQKPAAAVLAQREAVAA